VYEEVDLLSKCTLTDAANNCAQNSFEDPMSKTIQISGSQEMYSLDHSLWHTCTKILEHDIVLSHIFTTEAKFHFSGCISQHSCVTGSSEPPREHFEQEQGSAKVKVWCMLTQGTVIGLVFFDGNITESSSLLDMLENYALP
jgi:hypothetical protein